MQFNLLGNISLHQLQQAVVIREKIDDLERELSRIIGGASPRAAKATRQRKGGMSAATRSKLSASMKARWAMRNGTRRVARSAGAVKAKEKSPLKERIVGTLKAVGKSGVTVKDMASKLGTSYGNINVWFHTTAKGMKEIKKVEPGRFAWVS